MPDSLLASRIGVGTKSADAVRVGHQMDYVSVDKQETGSISPTNIDDSKSQIDFTVRLGSSIRGNKNRSNNKIYSI